MNSDGEDVREKQESESSYHPKDDGDDVCHLLTAPPQPPRNPTQVSQPALAEETERVEDESESCPGDEQRLVGSSHVGDEHDSVL